MKNILLLTDNQELLKRFRALIAQKELNDKSLYKFEYAFSAKNQKFKEDFKDVPWIRPLRVKDEVDFLINEYDIIFSLHCKQIFPAKLVQNVKCINIHPGLNPHNRGWFPQAFSIVNGLPCGATIHEIDELLDHGGVICQKEVEIEAWDTSFTAYNKILDAEIELLSLHIEKILQLDYSTTLKEEGNLNLKKDFDALCKVDLNKVDTFQNHLNLLRALTHDKYDNAFFYDDKGNKIIVKVELKKV